MLTCILETLETKSFYVSMEYCNVDSEMAFVDSDLHVDDNSPHERESFL